MIMFPLRLFMLLLPALSLTLAEFTPLVDHAEPSFVDLWAVEFVQVQKMLPPDWVGPPPPMFGGLGPLVWYLNFTLEPDHLYDRELVQVTLYEKEGNWTLIRDDYLDQSKPQNEKLPLPKVKHVANCSIIATKPIINNPIIVKTWDKDPWLGQVDGGNNGLEVDCQ